MADNRKQTCNSDIHSMSRRINRIIAEVNKSQSSAVSATMPFDMVRMRSYITALQRFMDFVVSQPLLDLPETGPQPIDLPVDEPMPRVENESAYDVCQYLSIMRDELVGSQSSRLSTNLVKFDYDRASAVITKIGKLLDYVAASEPLDLPESSPREASSGLGAQGI